MAAGRRVGTDWRGEAAGQLATAQAGGKAAALPARPELGLLEPNPLPGSRAAPPHITQSCNPFLPASRKPSAGRWLVLVGKYLVPLSGVLARLPEAAGRRGFPA